MKEIIEITTNAGLEVGRYYHCFNKKTISHSVQECKIQEGDKYFQSKIWAADDNNQALEMWRIYGPIDPPNIGGIYLCNKHGGYGFQSDCQRCELLKGHSGN